jgi:predicted dithiol-disulfide oxidoreductase (DUF899 family)
MMRLNVEEMASKIGLQLNSDTAIAAVARMNLEKLEAQLSKQNKRFKVINNQANEFNKRNS